MNNDAQFEAYSHLFMQGPFSGLIDPWAETGSYFPQIHTGMIGHLVRQIQHDLFRMGYVAGREVSLQIAEKREPDFYIERRESVPKPSGKWDYTVAATQALAEPGVSVVWDIPELDAVYIRERGTGRLVTVAEIISPGNKDSQKIIWEYQERRTRLLQKGINVVEIDPTRSVKRLIEDKLVHAYTYHTAIYLPEELPRLIGVDFGEALKRIALPLQNEVIAVEPQAAYDDGYQVTRIAVQINDASDYAEDSLPFPTLLTPQQRQNALAAVAKWQAELERLRNES